MVLTVKSIEALQARDKTYKVADGAGLYLLVSTTGSKTWRFKYRFDGKENVLTIGDAALVGLAEARAARDEAKRLLLAGKSPNLEKRKAKAAAASTRAVTVEATCRRWHSDNVGRWSPRHGQDVIHSLERDVFPQIGHLPLVEVSANMLSPVLERIEARGAIETAHRVRQRLEMAFAHGLAKLGLEKAHNPATTVKAGLKPVVRSGHNPAAVDLEAAQAVVRDLEESVAGSVVKLAHRLLALTAVRPGMLLGARWDQGEFKNLDGDAPLWVVPACRMKLGAAQKQDSAFDFFIPLSTQAVDVLNTVSGMTGRCDYVFPNARSWRKPMSENAINYALHRAGYHSRQTGHGWRASFSTIMNGICEAEGTGASDCKIINLMLAHGPKDRVEAAYNRQRYMPRRRVLAQRWADILLEGRPSAPGLK